MTQIYDLTDTHKEKSYRVICDPGDFPLEPGLLLGTWEVRFGILYQSFNPGMVIERDKQRWQITRIGNAIALEVVKNDYR